MGDGAESLEFDVIVKMDGTSLVELESSSDWDRCSLLYHVVRSTRGEY